MLSVKVCIALLIVALSVVPQIGHAESALLLQTDTTWLATSSLPGEGWSYSLDYDDTGWWNAQLAGASYAIWCGNYHNGPREGWFRKEFPVNGTVVSATVDAGFDDCGDVFVNGTRVVNNRDYSASDSYHVDVTSYLHSGINLVSIYGWDSYGVDKAVWVKVNAEVVPEPCSLIALLAGGLGCLASVLRKHRR